MLNYVACSCHIYAQGWLMLISCLILYLAMASAFLKWLNRVVVGEPEERNEEATQRDAQDAAQESQQEMRNKKVNMPEAEKEVDTEGASEEMERNEESKCDKATQREHTKEMKQEATQETNDMITQQTSSEEEEPVKQKDSDKQEEVPDTNQPVPKKEYNILIIPITVTDCSEFFKHGYNDTSLEDSFIVANHIVKEEGEFGLRNSMMTIYTSAEVLFDYEVTRNDETYSFNIGYVRQGREIEINDNGLINILAREIPRYVVGLHLVIFVTSCTKSIPVTKSIIKRFPPEAQSISLLVVTQCNRDKNMSDKERKDIIDEFDGWCGSYKMKKGIIPVCFRDGDFHLSGPRKGFHARRIREDEEILLDLIINQCEEMVPVKSILIPEGNESDSD